MSVSEYLPPVIENVVWEYVTSGLDERIGLKLILDDAILRQYTTNFIYPADYAALITQPDGANKIVASIFRFGIPVELTTTVDLYKSIPVYTRSHIIEQLLPIYAPIMLTELIHMEGQRKGYSFKTLRLLAKELPTRDPTSCYLTDASSYRELPGPAHTPIITQLVPLYDDTMLNELMHVEATHRNVIHSENLRILAQYVLDHDIRVDYTKVCLLAISRNLDSIVDQILARPGYTPSYQELNTASLNRNLTNKIATRIVDMNPDRSLILWYDKLDHDSFEEVLNILVNDPVYIRQKIDNIPLCKDNVRLLTTLFSNPALKQALGPSDVDYFAAKVQRSKLLKPIKTQLLLKIQS